MESKADTSWWLFVDESGQTGGVTISKKGKRRGSLNFESLLFVNAVVLVKDGADLSALEATYENFKLKFSHLLKDGESEIKGSDLATRRFNHALDCFIDRLLDDVHFYVNVYDKKFYLATLLLAQVSPEMFSCCPDIFYSQAAFLAKQDDDFFVRYCQFVENSGENQREYLDYLVEYSYKDELPINALKEFIVGDRSQGLKTIEEGSLLSAGAYSADKKMVNLVNLNCLAEMLVLIKEEKGIDNCQMRVVHDNISGIDKVIEDELAAYGVSVSFKDSEDSLALQLADNLASLFAHFLNRTMKELKEGSAWREDSRWDMRTQARLFRAIGWDHIKLTVPLDDLCVYAALVEIFDECAPDMSPLEMQLSLNYLAQKCCEERIKELGAIPSTHLHDALSKLAE